MIKAFDIQHVFTHHYSDELFRAQSLSSDKYENVYSKFRHEYNRSHGKSEIDEYEKYNTIVYITGLPKINEPYMMSIDKIPPLGGVNLFI